MIKELRIGNLVNCKLIGMYRIESGDIEKGKESLYTSIPLSPDILEKLGFVKSPAANSTYKPIPELKAEIHFEEFRGELVCILYCSTGSFIPQEIKYTHQLQNLYFALTGSELDTSKLINQ